MSDKEKLSTAQWVFERQVAWIVSADVKVGFVVALNAATLSTLADVFAKSTDHTTLGNIASGIAGLTGLTAIACAAIAMFPRLSGPYTSLLFFGKIVGISSKEYSDRFRDIDDSDLLRDWTDQIHRNAEIAHSKHRWVRRGIAASFLGSIPWIASIYFNIKL